MPSSSPPSEWTLWLPTLSLSFAAFNFNTTEFVPVGLLTSIAADFSLDVSHTGLLISVYAWAVALLSLPLTLLTARYDRRKLLAALFGLFIVSHLLAGIAWRFEVLMAARLGIASAHAVFWAIAVPLAVRVAPSHKRHKALGLVVAGSSLATVLGVPLGTLVGQHLGWRVTFGGIAVIAFGILMVLFRLLPALPSQNAGSLKSLPQLLRRPTLVWIYVLIAIIVSGDFTAYTYIGPFMENVAGFGRETVVWLLLLIGGAGLIGSHLYARYASRYPARVLMWPLGGLGLCLALLNVASANLYALSLLSLFWGATVVMLILAFQSRMLEAAPDAADVATALFSGIFNIGIGGGALLGGWICLSLNTAWIGYAGALILLFAFTLGGVFIRETKKPVA
jgi:DHA1 family L-arabinose/isopropyl-beta-D-thiogalactopyranoside export protein-like MFS transporter